eukprot:s1135_g7.t7
MFRSQLATLTLGTSVVDAALTQGYSTHTIQHDGAEREFKVYLPSNSIYTGLFLMHHGWTEDMDSACTYGEIQKYAEEYGFVGVCPQGLRYGNGETGWNVGTCCAGADTAGTDDLGFIRKVVEFVNAEVSIPAGRTYAGGFSNGCALSFRLACELSDVIFGVGCAGAAYDHAYTGRGVLSCNPANPRPYWSQIGSFDSFYSVTDSKAGWRRYATEVLRCGSATEVVYNQDSVTCEEHTSCPVAKSSRFCEMIWEAASGSLVRVLSGFAVSVCCIAFAPSGDLLAATGADGQARLWNIQTGEALLCVAGHQDVATGVAFAADGQCIATCSSDGTAVLWNIESGCREATLEGHSEAVMAATFVCKSDLAPTPTKTKFCNYNRRPASEPGRGVVPIMIGIIGDSNTGKSTLLNALLGQKLLPTSYKSCTSAITNVQLLKSEQPKLSYQWNGAEEVVEGRREILARIKSLNEQVRERESKHILDLCVACSPIDSLVSAGICDGSLRLVDMPGQDETDNPVVKDCFQQLLSMCHGLIILVKYNSVKSDSLAVLLDRISDLAPHLYSTPGALTFVISQCDALRADGDSDDEVDTPKDAFKDLKKELLQYLANRDCLMLYPGFLSDVRVLCVSVDQKMVGGHEFGLLVEAIGDLHGIIAELKRARQVKLCQEITDTCVDRLQAVRGEYPSRAQEVISAAKQNELVNQASMAVAAASFIVTIPLGGWGLALGCAVRCAAAGTALGLGVAASAVHVQSEKEGQAMQEGESPTLGGVQCLGGGALGALGAEEANRRVVFDKTAASLLEGKVYEDTLVDPAGGAIYIGEFVGEVPHGRGRLFWSSTNYEAFIGRFKNGMPREGSFLNEKGFCVARCKVSADGIVSVSETTDEELTEAEEETPSPASPCETLEDFLNLEPAVPLDSKLPVPLDQAGREEKVKARQGVSQSRTEAVSWATGPFGDCIVECSVPLQRRDVQCRTMHDGPAEDTECEGMQRPVATKACDCSTMLCVSETSKACEEQHTQDFNTRLTSDASEDVQQDMADCIGCFPLSDDELHESPDAYNDSCVHWNSPSPCRSGLPFYSMRSKDLDTSLCQSFCTSKGLDLSGIVGGKDFGVPPTHLQLSAQDISYLDSIVSGGTRDVPKESSPDPDLASPSATAPSLVTWDYLPGFQRPCDGYGSCGAAKNWRPRGAPTSGEWEEVTFAHYYFDERYGHMDQTRKEAFREATAVYHRRTCIRFVEVESNFTGVTLRVGNYNSGSCWASYLGYPSSGTSSDFRRSGFNLGSCMNLNHMGEILHNLGHVLGMLDEQNRPDATRVYHGHGPHLRVFWDNLPNSWSFLFSEVEEAYTGSPWPGGSRRLWKCCQPRDGELVSRIKMKKPDHRLEQQPPEELGLPMGNVS